tara:strand:- start:1514 stop:2968 length:1455 start_codon:yes stop_codon:yes gene_type:complete
MKQIFIINSDRKSYSSKSISGYKKIYLLKSFEKSLISRNYYNSLYFGFEIFCSGYFNDFWNIIFLVYFQYIHVINPELPLLILQSYQYYKKLEKKMKEKKIDKIKMRNLLELQNHIIFIIKNMINTKNKHISYFIKPNYSNQNTYKYIDQRFTLVLFKRFKLLLNKIINHKITFTLTSTEVLKEFFDILGKIMVIDCENNHLIDYPFQISVYHHEKSNKNFKNISQIFWNTILSSSKFNQNIFKQVGCIYKIFQTHNLTKLEKESYIYLTSVLFFVYKVKDINILKNKKDDYLVIKNFYENIQISLNNKTRRLDYIDITNINDRSNNKKNKKYAQTTIKNKIKQKKNKKEKIEMKDIIINMKPINYILNNKIDKKENNNIEKKFIEKKNNKKEENIFDFNICKQKYEDNQDNSHIEIVFSNDNKTDQYNNFRCSLFNFNNLPQKEEKIITKNNNVSEKTIDIPNKIYRKSVLSKPFSEITKDLN